MNSSEKTLFLIDGSALFYRAHFAFIRNPLINSKGENTSATFGFVNSLLKIIRDESPDYLAIAFDTAQPTFRHEMYVEYKSTRAKMPDDLVAQIPRIKAAADALNIPAVELPGMEADDLIGTLAVTGAQRGLRVWCVTGDKDFFQLVNDRIGIYNPKGGSDEPERFGREEVKAKFGVYPERIIDMLALMGDSSDNVPGVPGIGPKTAVDLLNTFGSFDELLARYDEIKAKGTRAKIAENLDTARLSRELVTIKTDVALSLSIEDLARRDIDYDKCKTLFLELEFTRLLRSLMPEDKPEPAQTAHGRIDHDYRTVSSIAELQQIVGDLLKREWVAVDTETTSLDSLQCDLVGVSLSAEPGLGWYIPVGHEDSARNLPLDQTVAQLKPLLSAAQVRKIGQNIKYDLEVLRRYDLDITPIGFDTMLAAYVLDPSSREYSLDFLAMRHFDYQTTPITALIGSGKKQKSFATVDIDAATRYAVEDADYTFRLWQKLSPSLAETGLEPLYYEVELPLISVLADIEAAGIRVDTDYLGELSVEMSKKLEKLCAAIYHIAGGEFNINSTQQLSHILFEKLGLPTKGKTAKKTGYSTDVTVLEELAHLHEFPRLILDYRQLTKLQSTYVDAIPRLVNPHTGRVHTSFNQTVAATGRLSSTDPNLQNIPVRTDEGREIRRAFVAGDDKRTLLVADYSQIELRILAHYSDDKSLIRAFRNNEDIHARTAAEVYGTELASVTPAQRRAAKTANFAIIYGVSAFGLSQQSEMTVDEARQFIDTYFERYPGIRQYIETTKQAAREQGFVTTLFNRRRYIPEINSKNFNIRQFAERTAINTPIQGTAADLIKVAMLKIAAPMKKMRSQMVLQVHDELVFDVYSEELEDLKAIVRDGMEHAVKLKVPIQVEMGSGPNWLEAK